MTPEVKLNHLRDYIFQRIDTMVYEAKEVDIFWRIYLETGMVIYRGVSDSGIKAQSFDDYLLQFELQEQLAEITKTNEAPKYSNEIIITDHAFGRAKERLSMNHASFAKLAEKAYFNGIRHSDCVGNLRKYIDKQFFAYRTANNIRIYGENIFLFSKNVLKTVYQIPNNLRKAALKNQQSNQQ